MERERPAITGAICVHVRRSVTFCWPLPCLIAVVCRDLTLKDVTASIVNTVETALEAQECTLWLMDKTDKAMWSFPRAELRNTKDEAAAKAQAEEDRVAHQLKHLGSSRALTADVPPSLAAPKSVRLGIRS